MASIPVSGDEFLAAVALYRDLVAGKLTDASTTSLARLGAYAHLVVDASGGWAPDAAHLLREEIAFAVDSWLAEQPPAPPRRRFSTDLLEMKMPGTQESAAVRAAVVRLSWGLTGPPRPATQAADAIGLEFATPSTARSWGPKIPTARVLAALSARAGRFIPHRIPAELAGRPAPWRAAPLNLPPTHAVDGLVARVRDALGEHDDFDEREIIGAIRRLVAADLRAGYLGHPAAPGHRLTEFPRQLRDVLDAWEDNDYLAFGPRNPAERSVTPVTLPVGAVIQLFCHRVTDDDPARRTRLTTELGRWHSALHLLDEDEAETRRERERREAEHVAVEREARAEWLEAQQRDRERRRDRLRDAVSPHAPLTASAAPRLPFYRLVLEHPKKELTPLTDPGHLTPEKALAASNAIRESPMANQPLHIDQYVTKRIALLRDPVERQRHLDPGGILLFSLADQGVHLQAMHARASAASRTLVKIIQSNPVGPYGLLAPRNRALEASKAEDHVTAIKRIDDVYEQVLARAEGSGFRDTQERLETLHQVALAATGILISTLEPWIAGWVGGPTPTLIRYVGALSDWSGLLGSYLDDLIAHVSGRPQQRHQDGHLFWADWVQTTYLNRMRASLAVHLATNAIIRGAVSPAVEKGDLDDLKTLFRTVLSLPELTGSSEAALTMQGTAIAAANDGWLPAVETPGAVLLAMDLLTAATSRIRSAPPEFEFRFEASARWHIRRRDGGFLARLAPNGSVRRFLADRGGAGFAAWIQLVDGAGLMRPRPRNA